MLSHVLTLICFLFAQILFQGIGFCEENQFKLEVNKPGIIEQALLNQAIENDLEIQSLGKKLGYTNFVRDTANITANTVMGSARVINLSSRDTSVRFITNGLLLGSDAINITTIGYKIYKEKKIKKEIEDRINFIKSELFHIFNQLETNRDNVEAKDKLTALVGENSTNDYLTWLESKSKEN